MPRTKKPAPNQFERLTAYLPLMWLSLAFLAGILAARQLHLARDFWLGLLQRLPAAQNISYRLFWLVLAALALLLAGLFGFLSTRRKVRIFKLPSSIWLLVSLCLVAFCLGAARFLFSLPYVDAHAIAWYNDRQYDLQVTGTVAGVPDERDAYTNLRIQASAVDVGDQPLPVHGLLLARVDPNQDWHYGDVVRLSGHLKTPPENEDFSYRDYLARQDILAYMPDAMATRLPFTSGSPFMRLVYAFKDQAVARLYRIFPDPEASLLAGILLGNDNGLPADLEQAYKNTGTAHIIAISGFNIAIIAGLFVTLFSRLLGRRRGSIAAVAGIVLYTLLVGASASVVRAAIMGSLAIFARQVGRRQNGLNTLAFTAAAMAAVDPNVLWDVGFQLSFGATLGLILYAQPFQDWFARLLARRLPLEKAERIAAPVGEFALFTLAAQLTTLPIMAYQFQRISLISVLANPFVLPVQPEVMVLSGLALLFSFVYLPLGQVFAWIAWPFAAYTNRAVEFFNRFPHGVIVLGDFSFLFVVLFYAVLFFLTFASPSLKQRLRPVFTPAVILSGLGISVYLVWSAAMAAPDGRLHLTFLPVGSADAILVQTPGGQSLLIDGGGTPSILADALGRRLSPFDRDLDWLVVASPEEAELAALPRTLDRFPPQKVLWAGDVSASYSAGEVDRWLSTNGTPVTQALPGMRLDLGKGASLQVLAAGPRGAVLLVEWQAFRALLPLGLNFDILDQLDQGKAIGSVTVLLLADSGYGPSNPNDWLVNLNPQVTILSVSAGDPNNLPDPDVIGYTSGSTLLRTDRNGWIEISTDGSGMQVQVQRK